MAVKNLGVTVIVSAVIICIMLQGQDLFAQQPTVEELPQQDADDILCGPRALLILCRMYGIDAELEELARLARVNEEGTNMFNLLKAAQAKGFSAVGRILKYNELLALKKPVIAFVNNNHFSVLEAIDKHTARISDEITDPLVISREEVDEMWQGHCLVVSKSQPIKKNAVPNIVFDKIVYDFGTMPRGSSLDYSFTISNKGGVPLKIFQVMGACDCMVSAPGKKILQPEEVTSVHVKVNLREKGRINRSFVVLSNDPYTKAYPLTITGKVVDALEVTPSNIFLRRIGVKDSVHRTIKLKAPKGKSLEIKQITIPEGVKIQEFLGATPNSVILEATVGPNLPPGQFSAHVKIELNNIYAAKGKTASPITIEIPIEGIVEGDLSVFPERFFLGFIPSGEEKSCTVELKNSEEIPIQLSRAQAEGDSVNVIVEPTKPGYTYKITATTQANAPQGQLKDTIRIYIEEQGAEKVVEIPLFGVVR